IIIETFRDSILFFCINSVIEGIDWPSYIKYLQDKYGETILIGVLHTKCATEKEQADLEKYYLFNLGIKCGCITIEYQKARNFSLIEKVMFANQACGRRKNVRALCDSTSRMAFTLHKPQQRSAYSQPISKEIMINGKILDVSASHFTCTLPPEVSLPSGLKIHKILVNINGMHFTTDAVLLAQRTLSETKVFVFGFFARDGKPGLDADVQPRVLQKIYQMVSDKVKALLRTKFDEAKNNAQFTRR
ncbi:MAG: hypothetical protein J6Y93_05635, partial [Treponema sp.]|nr:hypothetical protein [Treponema sp.]